MYSRFSTILKAQNPRNTTTALPVTITSTETDSTNTCKGTGAWEGNPGMDHWCEISCHFTPPNCPKSHCICDEENSGFTTTLDSITTNTINTNLDDTSGLTITGTSSLILTTGPDGTTRVSGNTGAFGENTSDTTKTFDNINIFGIDTTGTNLSTTNTLDFEDNSIPDTLFVPDIFAGTTDTNTIFVTDDFGGITDRSDTFEVIGTTTDFSEIPTTTKAPTTTSTTTITSPVIPSSKPRTCHGNGSWSHLNQWCNINCNHNPPYCPTTHCICDDD